MSKTNPVLILTWRRPEYLRGQLAAVKDYRPERVYVFSDGWRQGFEQEKQDVERCRREIKQLIDWECKVFFKMSERNLGCKEGVTTGIDWFFEHETQGIILEDDIVPSKYFWDYMDEYLERYRDSPEIGAVAGSSFILDPDYHRFDSYLSSICQVWGWGTWARAWRLNKPIDSDFSITTRIALRKDGYSESFISYWCERFREVFMGEVDTWDYGWIYACIKNGMHTCTPVVSLVRNIGFGEKATHTKDVNYQDQVRGILINTEYNVECKRRSVEIDSSVFDERFRLTIGSRARRRLSRRESKTVVDRLWVAVDIDESSYLEHFSYGDISYQVLCSELDRVWKQMGCDNKSTCRSQEALLDRYYRHPVWILNGLYSKKDVVSKRIRQAIARTIKDLNPSTVVDFGGGSGVLAEIIKREYGIDACVYDPYSQGGVRDKVGEAEVVIALDVLEHSDNPLQLLEEAKAMVKTGGYLMFGNCFYPLIMCHMAKSFYLRHIFRIACKLSGLVYIGNVCGAEYVGIYRLRDRRKRVGKRLDCILRIAGLGINCVGEVAKRLRSLMLRLEA